MEKNLKAFLNGILDLPRVIMATILFLVWWGLFILWALVTTVGAGLRIIMGAISPMAPHPPKTKEKVNYL